MFSCCCTGLAVWQWGHASPLLLFLWFQFRSKLTRCIHTVLSYWYFSSLVRYRAVLRSSIISLVVYYGCRLVHKRLCVICCATTCNDLSAVMLTFGTIWSTLVSNSCVAKYFGFSPKAQSWRLLPPAYRLFCLSATTFCFELVHLLLLFLLPCCFHSYTVCFSLSLLQSLLLLYCLPISLNVSNSVTFSLLVTVSYSVTVGLTYYVTVFLSLFVSHMLCSLLC